LYTAYKADFRDPEVERFLLARGGDRRAIFEENVRDIVAHNSGRDQTWQKGVNAFSEMTDEEFVQYYGIVKKDQVCTVAPPEGAKKQGLKVNLPDRWDWRDFGVVTPPKNQG
jgi:cathepsin L